MSCYGEFQVSDEPSHKDCQACGQLVDSKGESVETSCEYSPIACFTCYYQPCDESC